MKQIGIICVFFFVLLFAIVGCLYIFDVMSYEASKSAVVRFGAAIVLLGACSAAVTMLLGGKKEPQD